MQTIQPAANGVATLQLVGTSERYVVWCRFASFLGILTLESFTSASLGLAVGSVAPSTEAAVAIGPAVMVVFIVFGGGASPPVTR